VHTNLTDGSRFHTGGRRPHVEFNAALGLAHVHVFFDLYAVEGDGQSGAGYWENPRGAAALGTLPAVRANLRYEGSKADDDQTERDADRRARLRASVSGVRAEPS
jgi:hypothetical protein